MFSLPSRCFKFERAERGHLGVVRFRNIEMAAFLVDGAPDRPRVEAIMQREIAGERVENAFLRFDRDQIAPTFHGVGEG